MRHILAVAPDILRINNHARIILQVDGFVFQKAEAMSQDRDGLVVDNPPLPETLAHDPVLRRCKMVAACGTSDLLPRCGDRGFPHWGVWLEWNRNFHNDTLAYIAEGLEGKLSAMATRVTGRIGLSHNEASEL